MDVNRRRDAIAGTIQTITSIPKGGNVIFSHECTVYKTVDNGTLRYSPRRNSFIWRKLNINYNMDYSDRTSWMVLLISTLTWTCCKIGSFRNWKTPSIKNDV